MEDVPAVNTEETLVKEVNVENKSKTIKSEVKPKIDDFDWSTISDLNSSEELNKDEESMYFSTMPVIEEKQVLDGKVVSISDREVIEIC